MPILASMCSLLNSFVFSYFNSIILSAACVAAFFFGFLRCGKFTIWNQFDPEYNLCLNDIQITDECVFIRLNRSKTDPFRQGRVIPLYRTGYAICPVLAVSRYFQIKHSLKSLDTEAFFIYNDKTPLTRKFFITHVKLLLDKLGLSSDSCNGHSFRIGAATAAHESRLEDHLIQTLGGWSSDCYTRYIHTSPKVIQQAQKQLAKTDQSIVFNVLY
jgi:integrase